MNTEKPNLQQICIAMFLHLTCKPLPSVKTNNIDNCIKRLVQTTCTKFVIPIVEYFSINFMQQHETCRNQPMENCRPLNYYFPLLTLDATGLIHHGRLLSAVVSSSSAN